MKSGISPEPALLGFLRDGPLHGYDLHKRVAVQLGPAWHLGISQMYAILKEYEARGWIKTVVAPQNGRPSRKMLVLTPAGERAFEAWMAQTAHGLREFRVDFFARLYFARSAGRRALRAFLTKQIEATRRELSGLQTTPASSDYAALVTSFRITQLQTILEWLTTLRAAEQKPLTDRARRARTAGRKGRTHEPQ